MEESPFFEQARDRLLAEGDALAAEAARPDLVALLVPLPVEALWALSLGAAVRLAASDVQLTDDDVSVVVEATWRAITRP